MSDPFDDLTKQVEATTAKQRSRPTTIACPDCGNMVSVRAAACPACGGPVNAAPVVSHSAPLRPLDTRQIVGVEQTSKSLKLGIALSWTAFLIFASVMFVGVAKGQDKTMIGIGLVGCFISVTIALIVKIKIWWRHG